MKNQLKSPSLTRQFVGMIMAGLLVMMAATAVFASVTFNTSTGTGFVGKGDVQTPFGLNNAQMQTIATTPGGLTFRYERAVTYSSTCQWQTGNPDHPQSVHTHTHTKTSSASVNSVVAYDARTRNQVTGFNLNGFDGIPTVVGEDAPALGDVCKGDPDSNGNAPVGYVIDVSTDPTSVTSILYAVIGGISKQIWPAIPTI